MSPRVIRWVVLAVCVGGIAGMIAGSVADDNSLTLTFGLVTAAAVICLIVATAVSGGNAGGVDEAAGAQVEELVAALVADGADESAVRRLVQQAVELGRAQPGGKAGAGVHGGRTPRPGERTFT